MSCMRRPVRAYVQACVAVHAPVRTHTCARLACVCTVCRRPNSVLIVSRVLASQVSGSSRDCVSRLAQAGCKSRGWRAARALYVRSAGVRRGKQSGGYCTYTVARWRWREGGEVSWARFCGASAGGATDRHARGEDHNPGALCKLYGGRLGGVSTEICKCPGHDSMSARKFAMCTYDHTCDPHAWSPVVVHIVMNRTVHVTPCWRVVSAATACGRWSRDHETAHKLHFPAEAQPESRRRAAEMRQPFHGPRREIDSYARAALSKGLSSTRTATQALQRSKGLTLFAAHCAGMNPGIAVRRGRRVRVCDRSKGITCVFVRSERTAKTLS